MSAGQVYNGTTKVGGLTMNFRTEITEWADGVLRTTQTISSRGGYAEECQINGTYTDNGDGTFNTVFEDGCNTNFIGVLNTNTNVWECKFTHKDLSMTVSFTATLSA